MTPSNENFIDPSMEREMDMQDLLAEQKRIEDDLEIAKLTVRQHEHRLADVQRRIEAAQKLN